MKNFGVFGLVKDNAGRVLLVKQKRGRGTWSLPGGKLQSGERVIDGLLREVREETGLEVKPLDLAMCISRETQNYFVLIFTCSIVRKRELDLTNNTEIEEIAYFPMHRLPTPLSVQAAACLFRIKQIKRAYTPYVEITSL